MEVHLTPEIEKKLNDIAAQSGRSTDELVNDAIAGLFDELQQSRNLEQGYREMAADRSRESEALEWAENLTSDAIACSVATCGG